MLSTQCVKSFNRALHSALHGQYGKPKFRAKQACLNLQHKISSHHLVHFNDTLVFFSPFSIAITWIGEERANLSAFRTFVRFVLVWVCRFPLPLGVWEGLRFVIVALPGLFSYPFLLFINKWYYRCNSTTHIQLECGQLAPQSSLSRNKGPSRISMA